MRVGAMVRNCYMMQQLKGSGRPRAIEKGQAKLPYLFTPICLWLFLNPNSPVNLPESFFVPATARYQPGVVNLPHPILHFAKLLILTHPCRSCGS